MSSRTDDQHEPIDDTSPHLERLLWQAAARQFEVSDGRRTHPHDTVAKVRAHAARLGVRIDSGSRIGRMLRVHASTKTPSPDVLVVSDACGMGVD